MCMRFIARGSIEVIRAAAGREVGVENPPEETTSTRIEIILSFFA